MAPPAFPPASACLQVLDGLNYYLGVTYIPDDRVVHELLGVPTFLLHEAIDVRAPAAVHSSRGGGRPACLSAAGATSGMTHSAMHWGWLGIQAPLAHPSERDACLLHACGGRLASWW